MKISWQQAIGTDEKHLSEFSFSKGNVFLVNTGILNDLSKLLTAAKIDGVDISIISSFRSFDRQLTIWNDKWMGYRPVYSRHGRPLNLNLLSDIEKYKAIALWSALPGFSRHHWGTDLDIFSCTAIAEGHQVELTPSEFSKQGVCCDLAHWLDKNLERYGFFRPYLQYNQGVSEEPWHISHKSMSQKIYQSFPFQECYQYIAQSNIQQKDFICSQLPHYKTQYFENFIECGKQSGS
ncbi:MAG: M15 family metallopeptidase [Kangiellaceae bacterium]|nr:M15 family metallopeptidase [Kangiellaceae bacterium]